MAKVVIMICVLGLFSIVQGSDASCIACHQKQQIPSELIYKRYLMKYSTNARMEASILSYLQNPQKKNSIMPSIFFLKFPMKEKTDKDALVLREEVSAFLERFNVKHRLVNSH